ncbi:MAG: alanine racemase [Pseudomonadota bacterium]
MANYPYPTLEVNLAAVTHNYNLLAKRNNCAAVVKANGYGLGISAIAPTLYEAGCREFFVANLEEGIELRNIFSDNDIRDNLIYVFHGVRKNQAQDFIANDIIPVINNPIQFENWQNAGKYALHVDTGMCRLGYEPQAAKKLQNDKNICLLISHLACADEPEHKKNAEQLTLFKELRKYFPNVRASLANSAGAMLKEDYYFDLLRPGCALYGISPNKNSKEFMNVVNLSAPVLQYTELAKNQTIGYGATKMLKKGAIIATLEIGYADGFMRSLSNNISGYVNSFEVPLVGRVSMDMVTVDVSNLPKNLLNDNLRISFINDLQSVNKFADLSDTIGYEIFTKIGNRVKRIYKNNFY